MQNHEVASLTPEERARVVREIEARVQGYFDAIRNRDLDHMLGFWADKDGFVFAGDGTLVLGYAAYAAQLRTAVADTASVPHIEAHRPQVHVLGPDAAVCSTEFEWSIISLAGVTTNSRGAWTYVFQRFPEGWRVIHSGGTHLYA
jgi:ketosteroid isomerase-like protein